MTPAACFHIGCATLVFTPPAACFHIGCATLVFTPPESMRAASPTQHTSTCAETQCTTHVASRKWRCGVTVHRQPFFNATDTSCRVSVGGFQLRANSDVQNRSNPHPHHPHRINSISEQRSTVNDEACEFFDFGRNRLESRRKSVTFPHFPCTLHCLLVAKRSTVSFPPEVNNRTRTYPFSC